MEGNLIENGTRMDYETPTLTSFDNVDPRFIALMIVVMAAAAALVVVVGNLNMAVNVNAAINVNVTRT